MRRESFEESEDLSDEEKLEIIESWFDDYEIKTIVIKRPDIIIRLKD
jgi:hypothetical protein